MCSMIASFEDENLHYLLSSSSCILPNRLLMHSQVQVTTICIMQQIANHQFSLTHQQQRIVNTTKPLFNISPNKHPKPLSMKNKPAMQHSIYHLLQVFNPVLFKNICMGCCTRRQPKTQESHILHAFVMHPLSKIL